MIVVPVWTGLQARALRTALRMPVLVFAEHLGVGSRTVSDWERERARIVPTPVLQAALDTALSRADGEAKARFHALAGSGAVVVVPDSRQARGTETTRNAEKPSKPWGWEGSARRFFQERRSSGSLSTGTARSTRI
ncbi:MAG: helix-turn-helix domain-containing protein [Egibacteraceae bacterium]